MKMYGLIAGLSLASLAIASAAEAQDSGSPTGAAPNAVQPSPDPVVQDIVVTAERRAEKTQNVPITVVNISTEMMKRANINNLSDLVKVTPGVSFDGTLAYVSPTMRGVGTSIFLPGGGTNVGIYLDGFYSPAPAAQDFNLMNISSIQVLKGPQGTLFGRNTTGGAFLLTTSKPSTDTKVVAEAAYGSYNSQRYQVYATTGLSDKLAVDIAAQLNKGDGWVKNIYTGDRHAGRYNNNGVRVGVNYQATDDFSLLFRYEHTHRNDPTALLSNGGFFLDGHSATAASYIPGAVVATKRGEISEVVPLSDKSTGDAYQLTANLDLGFADLTSYTQYRKDRDLMYYSLDYSSAALASLYTNDKSRVFTQEILLNSKPGSRLQWTAGAFYFDWHEGYEPAGLAPGGVANPPQPYPTLVTAYDDTRSYSIYGNATYELLDNLFLTAGLRYNHDQVVNAYQYFTPVGFVVRPPNMTNTRVTPRGVIRYQLNERSSIYASVSEGYKAAIYNVTDAGLGANTPIKPETLWAYEVGYKYSARNFGMNIAGFYYDYKNQQVQTSATSSGVPLPKTTNAASSRIYGIDADIRYQLNSNFSVNGAIEWLHARYRSFPAAIGLAVPSLAGIIVDSSGRPLQRAPNFSGNAGAAYTTEIAGGRFVLSGNVFYTTRFYMDLADQVAQGGYATLDLRAEWTDPSDRFTFAISGKNVTDTHYLKSTFESAGLGVGAIWGEPAMVEGSVRVRF